MQVTSRVVVDSFLTEQLLTDSGVPGGRGGKKRKKKRENEMTVTSVQQSVVKTEEEEEDEERRKMRPQEEKTKSFAIHKTKVLRDTMCSRFLHMFTLSETASEEEQVQ